jgi:2-succinyl-5-enolpyruvyl-6-hydroxy-3-cyclohexene-1-carboxylate synthase
VLIVVDNGGGGLFDLLPQAEHAPGFERLFVAPHGRDLVSVGDAFGANASRVETVAEMAQVASDLLRSGGVDIVVVPVDRETDLKQRRSLDEVARTVSAGLR